MFWSFQKMLLPLHSQFENEGSVAQLNRASDYGSEGYRFESCRSHFNTFDWQNFTAWLRSSTE